MTTREFIQHLVLNGELDDQLEIEVHIPDGVEGPSYHCFVPSHVTHINDYKQITLVECRPHRGDEE